MHLRLRLAIPSTLDWGCYPGVTQSAILASNSRSGSAHDPGAGDRFHGQDRTFLILDFRFGNATTHDGGPDNPDWTALDQPDTVRRQVLSSVGKASCVKRSTRTGQLFEICTSAVSALKCRAVACFRCPPGVSLCPLPVWQCCSAE
jgi:hypothetical protein